LIHGGLRWPLDRCPAFVESDSAGSNTHIGVRAKKGCGGYEFPFQGTLRLPK
jgi:hypothetical protein